MAQKKMRSAAAAVLALVATIDLAGARRVPSLGQSEVYHLAAVLMVASESGPLQRQPWQTTGRCLCRAGA